MFMKSDFSKIDACLSVVIKAILIYRIDGILLSTSAARGTDCAVSPELPIPACTVIRRRCTPLIPIPCRFHRRCGSTG